MGQEIFKILCQYVCLRTPFRRVVSAMVRFCDLWILREKKRAADPSPKSGFCYGSLLLQLF
jgi:hypothetical protein